MTTSLPDKDACFPDAHSTPKKTYTIYDCPHCSRTYRVKFYYEKHLLTHTSKVPTGPVPNTNTDGDSEDDVINDSSLNISNITIFKKPQPVQKKKVAARQSMKNKHFICTFCLKAYVTHKSMKRHERIHTIHVAASKYPDAKEIIDNAESIGSTALTEVSNCHSSVPSGQCFREVIGHVASINNFSDFCTKVVVNLVTDLEKRKCMLPSAIMKFLFDKMETALGDENFLAECSLLLDIRNFDEDAQSQFLHEFLLSVTPEIFNFVSTTFRSHYPRIVRPMPELDEEDKQVVYYVAGSIMRGYLRMSYRYKCSLKWKEICSVLKSHVLCSNPVGEIDAEWTRNMDRGGLLFINSDCQKFFVSLTELVYQNENKNGSIDFDLITKLVAESNTSVLWDNVVKNSLPEEVSVGLMNDVVSSFCKACGRGIARKRLNLLREKPVISMPTRHAVASRKQ